MGLESYEDEHYDETFPHGRMFRISFDSNLNRFRIRCHNQNDFDRLKDAFSDQNPQYFFMKQYGYSVSPTISMINDFGVFPTGLLFSVIRYVKTIYGSISVIEMSKNCRRYISDYLVPLKTALGGRSFGISNVSEDSGRNDNIRKSGGKPYLFRDYQENAIRNLVFRGYGRGMISLPTASGKSNVICNYVYNLMKHVNPDYVTLLLVPNKQLVFQMYNDFADYGFDMSIVTKFTAGLKKNERYDSNAKVIIANRQYVFKNKSLLPRIDVLFCDEVHQCQADSTSEFIENLDCRLKSGCSGSIPKTKYGKWTLVGMFGDVVSSEEITDLQKQGFISEFDLYQLNVIDGVVESDRNYLFHLRPLRRYCPDENGYSEIPFNAAHEAEHEYYEKNYRELYAPILRYISRFDDNTLILFDRIEFGKRLTEMSSEIFEGKRIHYIDGSVDIKDRLAITEQMENSDGNVLFAEFATFSTGINVKRLTNLVFVSSSKAFPRILQSIGRTLRLHKDKEKARIFDINFNFKYSRKHLRERLEIYRTTYHKTPDFVETFKI